MTLMCIKIYSRWTYDIGSHLDQEFHTLLRGGFCIGAMANAVAETRDGSPESDSNQM